MVSGAGSVAIVLSVILVSSELSKVCGYSNCSCCWLLLYTLCTLLTCLQNAVKLVYTRKQPCSPQAIENPGELEWIITIWLIVNSSVGAVKVQSGHLACNNVLCTDFALILTCLLNYGFHWLCGAIKHCTQDHSHGTVTDLV